MIYRFRFSFYPIRKVANSEIFQGFHLLQILILSIALSVRKFKVLLEFHINTLKTVVFNHVTYAFRVNLHSVIPLQSLKLHKSGLFQARSSLTFRQLHTKCRLTLCDMIHVCDMIQKDSKLHHTDKYSQHSLIIWPIWLNG